MIVLGLMSGTSLDGVDLTLISFKSLDEKLDFNLLQSATIPYPDDWHQSLKEAHELERSSLEKLSQKYGSYLAGIIQDFLKNSKRKPDLIASHGHTVLHQPEKGFTVQIGNGPEINQLLGIPVVCDFRVQDVKLGGQGAPLVPIGDRLLFPEFDSCVNLGGFINLSFEQDGNRVAYDVCPMNIVMNDLAAEFGKSYDDRGALARSGVLIESLFGELNDLDYYSESAPKSLGKEWVLENVWPKLKDVNPKDALRTWVEHNALQLAKSIQGKPKVLLTGGGVFNDFFMERLAHYSTSEMVIPIQDIIEYKEALIFGLLGYLRWNEKINVLASVTGAKEDHSSGVIFR
jgi:anhydro-N-acetylmuramic acid kinase